jgi:membrane protein DedA with SNARE-associated domain
MHLTIFHSLRSFVGDYGYWAVALALLAEGAGVPVPGEITLLLASFMAYSEHKLNLGWVIVIATCAATLGAELGYAIGNYGGRPLLDRYQKLLRISPATLQRGEEMFVRYGAVTVFLSRFIFGLRTFAGLLAGVLRMRWRTFSLFNFLGAAVWVAFMSTVGYLFGQHWRRLLSFMQRFNLAVLIVAAVVILFLWWRHRQRPKPDHL